MGFALLLFALLYPALAQPGQCLLVRERCQAPVPRGAAPMQGAAASDELLVFGTRFVGGIPRPPLPLVPLTREVITWETD